MATKGKGIAWGADLYRGLKFDTSSIFNLNDVLPFQPLEEEDKTPEWLHAVADHYEAVGWRNVERKAGRIQRNYWLRHGKLNPNDYVINPTYNEYYEAMGWLMPGNESPLEQFYPLIPNIVDVLRGEFIKRNDSFTVTQIDNDAVVESLQMKEEGFKDAMKQLITVQKQYELTRMGLVPDANNQEVMQAYQQEISNAVQRFENTEARFKNFRTVGAKWANKVTKVQEQRYSLQELEIDGFEAGLIADREFYHLDLMEDDFRLELLNPKWCDYHKGPGVKYVSDGDYFLWFDWMSTGDIINKYGTRIKEDDFERLRNIYSKVVGSLVVPDYAKSIQGSYYDTSKPYKEASALNPALNDALLGKELAYSFARSPNFDHNMEADIFSPSGNFGNRFNGEPQMFRVMNLYWRSLLKVGWLTKIERDGTLFQDWVTEDFKVTVEPKYDLSVVKTKSKENLIYGEHVDWTWVNQWRRIIKISPNQKHSFWLTNDQFSSIYIGGDPVPFQFKGRNNPYESKPPIEGCEYSWLNAGPNGLVDRLKPMQIIYNVAMNKVPKSFLLDGGNKLAMDKRIAPRNNAGLEAGVDHLEAFADNLHSSDVLWYQLSKESLEGLGQPALPQLINMSTVEQSKAYLIIAQMIKDMAGEVVGVTRQRQGQNKASETAYGIQQGITYSETQTEKYFDQHTRLMERVRQRMIDAAQYYSTFKETSREIYMNENEENVFLQIEGMQNLLPHYNIRLTSTANVRAALQQLSRFLIEENTLPFKPSEKIEAILSNSIPEIMELMRKGEVEAEQKAELEHQRQIELEEERRKTVMAQQELARQQVIEGKLMDRETQVEVATIRALGGVQTDSNKDSLLDSEENLDNYFKEKQLAAQAKTQQDNLNQKQQQHVDSMIDKQADRSLKQQDMANKLKIEQEKLKVAKANKNKYD
jgi:hypothetical protein